MPITVPTYDEYLSLLDRIDEHENASTLAHEALADQVARLTGVVALGDADAISLWSEIDKLADRADAQGVVINRLRRRLAELEGVDPDPDPDPPASTMLVGTSLHREAGEDHQEAFDRRTRNWGAEPEIIRYYDSDGYLNFWPQFGNAALSVSFKGHPADVLAGKYDEHYRQLFPKIPANTRWTYHHEPENDSFEPRLFRRAFAHVAAIADESAAGRASLRGPILMGWTVNPASGRDVNNFIPDTRLDFIGWDLYPSLDPADVRKKYKWCADATVAAGAPSWIICETGLHNAAGTPAQVAAWIPTAVGIAEDLGCDAWMYFDSTVGGDFRLTDPVEWAAMGEAIRR